MPSTNLILFVLYHVVVILTIVHVLMDNRQPPKTAAWILVIWFVPIAGIVLYLFFGVNTRKERMVSQRSLDELTRRSMLSFVGQQNLQIPQQHRTLIDLFINQSLSLPFKDSAVEVYTDGYQFFPALLKAIASAKNHIHIDIYIFEDDPLGRLVSDALIARARQGVEVRIIYDDVGCWRVSHSFFEHMREEGIEVVPFLPVRFPSFTSKANYRNHRKLFIVDGSTGFIGGMNIALRYVKGPGKPGTKPTEGSTPWRDTMVRITGPGVYTLQRAFLTDWYFVDRTLLSDRRFYPPQPANTVPGSFAAGGEASTLIAQTVTSGPDAPYPEIMQGYVAIVQSAQSYVYMQTPYFLPTEPLLFALKTAASAGIDVRLLVPLKGDNFITDWASRSYLREVAEAGIKVSLYTPGFLHSKLMVSDDAVTTIGSTNIDFRSFENNFEANTFFYGQQLAKHIRHIFLTDQAQSTPLQDLPHRIRPSFLARLAESLFRLLAPLM